MRVSDSVQTLVSAFVVGGWVRALKLHLNCLALVASQSTTANKSVIERASSYIATTTGCSDGRSYVKKQTDSWVQEAYPRMTNIVIIRTIHILPAKAATVEELIDVGIKRSGEKTRKNHRTIEI